MSEHFSAPRMPPRARSCTYAGSPDGRRNRESPRPRWDPEDTVPWEHHADAGSVIQNLRQRNYEIAAVETSVHSVDLFDWQPRFPVCILFGHEVDGLGAGLLELCDTYVRIPMLGRKHSLNVATAGGVVIYELLRKYRRMLDNAKR